MQTYVGPSVLPLVRINWPAIGWLGWAVMGRSETCVDVERIL